MVLLLLDQHIHSPEPSLPFRLGNELAVDRPPSDEWPRESERGSEPRATEQQAPPSKLERYAMGGVLTHVGPCSLSVVSSIVLVVVVRLRRAPIHCRAPFPRSTSWALWLRGCCVAPPTWIAHRPTPPCALSCPIALLTSPPLRPLLRPSSSRTCITFSGFYFWWTESLHQHQSYYYSTRTISSTDVSRRADVEGSRESQVPWMSVCVSPLVQVPSLMTDESLPCPQCPKSFPSTKLLQQHQQMFHTDKVSSYVTLLFLLNPVHWLSHHLVTFPFPQFPYIMTI